MADIAFKVQVFDPAVPFESLTLQKPGLDTWHTITIMTKALRQKFPNVRDAGFEDLMLSGGMEIRVPYVELGVQVGTIKIKKIRILIVDGGYHDLLLGSELINKAFEVGAHDVDDVSVSSAWKEDKTALSIELYPVEMPFDVRLLERYLKYQRRLYNIILIAERKLSFDDEWQLEDAIENDANIPEGLKLQLSAIDSGSIWTSLKSGAQSTLKRLASVFDTGASAKLAQQMADAKKAEVDAGISADIRDTTASRLMAEQEMLKAENLRKTYEIWRKEATARLKFMDDLIKQSPDDATKAALLRKKDEAIREIAEQQMLPMVRNVPQTYQPPEGLILLPGRSK